MRVARGRDGNMTVGVCNAACDRAWGLDISTGEMVTFTHEDGLVGSQPMSDASGRRPTRLVGRAEGAVIHIAVDCGEGSLAFGINGESPRRVPGFTFPPSTELRPWARLYGYTGEQLSMRGYVSVN